jgi:hypothetical protein
MRRWISTLILSLSFAVASSARAQTPAAPDTAEALFDRAQEHAKRGEYRAACPLYTESLRVDPQVGTLLNLADCEEHVGALVQALAHWREAIDRLGAGSADKFAAFARTRAEQLDARVPRLTVRLKPGAPAGTRVMRGGEELAAAALGVPMAVSPGPIELVVIAPGHEERRTTAELAEKDRIEITVEPGAELALPPVAPPATALPPPVPEPSWPRRHRVSLIVLGVAAAGVAAGIGVGAATKADYFDLQKTCRPGPCSDDQLARLHREAFATNGLFIAAGLTAVGGIARFTYEALKKPDASVAVALDGPGARLLVHF